MAATRFSILARQFSTSVTRRNLVNAPIQIFGVEGRYAHALYSAASKEKKLDSVEKDFKTFHNLINSNKGLEDYLLNPTLAKPEKAGVLVENGKLKKMKSVMNAFERIMSAHRGEITCVVTTAKELDAKNIKELEVALNGFLKKGEILQLTTKVDPSIIGGMIVTIGDKYVDMSTATKVKTYSNLLKQAV